MKKVYLAGKFKKSPEFATDIVKGFQNDFRAILLGDAKKMIYADDNVQINSKYGHIYCRYKSIKKIIKLWQILIIYLKNLTATCH